MRKWNHDDIFQPEPGTVHKQPGAREWQRSDWCMYEGARRLKLAAELKAAGERSKASKERLAAIKLLKEFRIKRTAALKEGYQPRSREGRVDVEVITAKMTKLERAMMHRRQANWIRKMQNSGYKIPEWMNDDPYTADDITLIWEHEHPGRKME
jgi:hypothetical protein